MFSLVFRTRGGTVITLPMADATLDDVVMFATKQIKRGRIVLGYMNPGGLTVQRFIPMRDEVRAVAW
jgi:hypothetical protein